MDHHPDLQQDKKDAQAVYDCVASGGVAIIPYDVAYAILCATEESLTKVYKAKNRPFEKASGVIGTYATHDAVHVLSNEKKDLIEKITCKANLPLSVIAPFRPDDPYLAKLSPFMFRIATKDGTVNILLNAGKFRDHVAELSWRHQTPFIGSSANRSSAGSRYRISDIEQEVKAAADITIDRGDSKYSSVHSISSTQIDFRTMKVVRFGHCYEEIAKIAADSGFALPDKPAGIH